MSEQHIVVNAESFSIPSCRVEMNHGHGKAVKDFLLAMLKMMFAPYLRKVPPNQAYSQEPGGEQQTQVMRNLPGYNVKYEPELRNLRCVVD